MKKTVIVQFEIDGFHSYPDAPEEVSFLSDKHRHTFIIKCGYAVIHTDREQEIFICRDYLRSYINSKYGNPSNFKNMSCEMIAFDILKYSISYNMIYCEVWEEKTGGARVEI